VKSTATSISCIILAGGEGKRVGGQDKGLVTYGGKTLIETVLNSVKPQVDDIIISANRNLDIYKQYCSQVVPDAGSSYKGPLAGILACLSHCQHERTLVIACDMPRLPDNLASRLSAAISDNDVAIASVDGHHQLAMLLKTDLSNTIQRELNKDNRKLMQWIKSLVYAVVDFDDQADAFVNLNRLPGSSA